MQIHYATINKVTFSPLAKEGNRYVVIPYYTFHNYLKMPQFLMNLGIF